MRWEKCSADGTAKSFDKLKTSKTPPRKSRRRNEESCGNEERRGAIVIPLVAGLVPIRVDPTPVIVTVRVEDVRVAVGNVRDIISITIHRVLSGLNRIRHHNAPKPRTKYLQFLKCLHMSHYSKRSSSGTLWTHGYWPRQRAIQCRPRIRLLPLSL